MAHFQHTIITSPSNTKGDKRGPIVTGHDYTERASTGRSLEAGSHDPTFWSQILFKFKEASEANQHFYELKQYQTNNWIRKMDRVNRP